MADGDRQRALTTIRATLSDDAGLAHALPAVYDELHAMAASYLRGQRPDHTLQPTALVNEAYLRFAGQPTWEARSREAFFALASRVMRTILVDHARSQRAAKRGGAWSRLTLSAVVREADAPAVDLCALDEALDRLARVDPDDAKLVELRFFGGLTSEAAGAVLGLSRGDVARRWRMVRAWLADEIRGEIE